MITPELVIAGCLFVLAAAHSALGESDILRPLFASDWTMAKTPRWATEKILRFAWHLTSFAWLALGLAILDVPLLPVVATMSLASAALIFVMLRGHLAWPLFLLAGVAALRADGFLEGTVLQGSALATAIALLAAAAVHVYWAFGGTWMLDRALPPTTPEMHFSPGPILTLAVAGALAVFATLVGMVAFDRGPEQLRWLVVAGVAVFTVRAIGDTKVAGFTKTVRDTAFASADDRWFTPLIVFLALGATGALLV